jgi:hypothetical protein
MVDWDYGYFELLRDWIMIFSYISIFGIRLLLSKKDKE